MTTMHNRGRFKSCRHEALERDTEPLTYVMSWTPPPPPLTLWQALVALVCFWRRT
jgi:hypothetical protein